MENKKYNGWTNYETWLVGLWLDNDSGTYAHWCEEAQHAYDQSRETTHDEKLADVTSDLAKEIESYHEQMIDESGAPTSGWIADFINAGMREVNWYEIAEHVLNNVDKVEDGPDWDQWDDSEYDVDAMKADHANGNFDADKADDYRHEAIVNASLVNGQYDQAFHQCAEYGLDYDTELARFNADGAEVES